MKSSFKPEFEKWYKKLPPHIREKAKKALKIFEEHDQSERTALMTLLSE